MGFNLNLLGNMCPALVTFLLLLSVFGAQGERNMIGADYQIDGPEENEEERSTDPLNKLLEKFSSQALKPSQKGVSMDELTCSPPRFGTPWARSTAKNCNMQVWLCKDKNQKKTYKCPRVDKYKVDRSTIQCLHVAEPDEKLRQVNDIEKLDIIESKHGHL